MCYVAPFNRFCTFQINIETVCFGKIKTWTRLATNDIAPKWWFEIIQQLRKITFMMKN